MATIRYVAQDAADKLQEARDLIAEAGAASVWNGMLLARILAPSGYLLNLALARILPGLRGRALPRVWSV